MKHIVGVSLVKNMKDIFYFKFYNFILNRNNKQEGFTIPELVISGAISFVVLLAGISFLKMNLQINKSDEVNLKLAGKVDNALDFIVDEINISERVIGSVREIDNLIQNGKFDQACKPLPAGDLVLALKIPSEHAAEKKSYKKNIKERNLVKAKKNCPIIYSLIRNNTYRGKGGPYYILQRTGPSINEKGYYEINNFKTTDVLDKVKNKFGDHIICGFSSGNKKSIKKEIKGIVLCIDEKGRGAEILVNAESPKNNNQLTVTKSSGGYTMINDKELISTSETSGGGALMPNRCEFFGNCLTTKKFTFFIDVSGSMGWSFQNRTFLDVAKEEAIDQIRRIPVNSGYMLNVYKFSNWSTPVFPNGPMLVTNVTKQKAIDFITGLRASGGTRPFDGLVDGIQKEHVEQMIILSDGVAYDKGQCFHNNRYYTFAECFADYNTKIRTRHVSIPAYKKVEVKVDTISLKYDFCSGNGIPNWRFWVPVYINGRFAYWRLEPINKKWLGDLARLNNGQCTHVK